MQNVPENTMPDEPDGRQDVHNSGVDTRWRPPICAGRPICARGGRVPSRPVTRGRASSSRKMPHEKSRSTLTAPLEVVHERHLLAPRP